MSSALRCLLALASILSCASAPAQDYPVKPIRMIVPVPAGGSSDILARMIGSKIAEAWGQQVVVDNRPGANGNIGAEIVSRASPDGYTLMMTDLGNLSISPSLYKLPFDVVRDFSPVTIVSYSPHMLLVHPGVPAKSVKELVALARARPGELNYATALGSAPHLAGLMFAHRTGIRWEYVPTKGGAESLLLVATGQAQALFGGLLAMLPHVKSGRLRALAVSSEQRVPSAPELPTIAEAGALPGFVTGTRQGLFTPARVPEKLIARLNAEVVRIVRLPEVVKQLTRSGAEPVGNSRQEMARLFASEKARWAGLIRETGFKLQ
jgi:tripartite-type tricarboxylate transporter receptor subunit TctC